MVEIQKRKRMVEIAPAMRAYRARTIGFFLRNCDDEDDDDGDGDGRCLIEEGRERVTEERKVSDLMTSMGLER